MPDSHPLALVRPPRNFAGVNWLGLKTLYFKEVKRFLKVFTQTVAAPVVTTLLFYAIFSLALGRVVYQVGEVPFIHFLAPGLIMMAMVQNAFANTSSSLMISKIQGNIVDVLMPPLTALELTIGFVAGGVTRGLLVGLVAGGVMMSFIPVGMAAPGLVLFHAVGASMMLSLLGMIGGIWSEKFDHLSAMTNFIIIPFSFLSGTFYSIERLPDLWRTVAHFNPFFYMIDGFRAGFIGQSDAPVWLGICVLLLVNLALLVTVYRMLVSGYRLKS